MIFQGAQDLFKLLVIGFALMGFVAVPVLGKTGLEHFATLLDSPEAQKMSERASDSLVRIEAELEAQLDGHSSQGAFDADDE